MCNNNNQKEAINLKRSEGGMYKKLEGGDVGRAGSKEGHGRGWREDREGGKWYNYVLIFKLVNKN